MSAQMGTSTETVVLYIPLLNEGTDVWRPTKGVVLGPDTVQVLATEDYDPNTEEWAFPPGSTVRCAKEVKSGGEC
jgi:hypothetical protein